MCLKRVELEEPKVMLNLYSNKYQILIEMENVLNVKDFRLILNKRNVGFLIHIHTHQITEKLKLFNVYLDTNLIKIINYKKKRKMFERKINFLCSINCFVFLLYSCCIIIILVDGNLKIIII